MTTTTPPAQAWAIQLFAKSVLKQAKFREVTALLGDTTGQRCLDIGSDNGVISYLLRQRGGQWSSADLNAQTVEAIRKLVQTDVEQIDGTRLPYPDHTFDAIAVVDFLEHIPDEKSFLDEAHRVLKPGGLLILNVPHLKHSLLRRLRHALGYTDEKHGHLRPGYTAAELRTLLGARFTVDAERTYSRFFSEFIDTLMNWGVSLLKRGKTTTKGQVVTGDDIAANQSMFKMYSLIYPIVAAFSRLDGLIPFRSGYMLINRSRANKQKQ